MTTLAIVNPASGNAEPERVEEALAMRLTDLVVRRLPREGDMMASLYAYVDALRPERLVVSGGDGTISAVATAMRDRLVPLGIVPTGTANLLARELSIPLDLDSACDVLVHDRLAVIDTMLVGQQRCLSRVGLGQIAEVGPRTSAQSKQATKALAYVAEAATRIFEPRAYGFRIELDGAATELRASSVVVTSVGTVGLAQLRWAEDVRPDDGVVDVFVIDASSTLERLEVLLRVVEGDARRAEGLQHLRAHRSVRIDVDEEIEVVADGEPRRGRSHAIDIVPRSLSVHVPG